MGGEVGALREWVAASGRRPEDFAGDERKRRHAVAAAVTAASEAHAAIAASGAAASGATRPRGTPTAAAGR